MNKQTTLDQLQDMKLNGMMRAYQAILSLPVHEQPHCGCGNSKTG